MERPGGGGCGKIPRGPQKYYPLIDDINDIRSTIVGSGVWNPADRCHLWVWAISGRLEEALALIKLLGFTYTSNFAWVKPVFGLGQYLRGQHELCLLGTRGEPAILPLVRNVGSVLEAPLGEHSRKPEEAYELIQRVSTLGPRLEMFARHNRPGWDCWGNELDPNYVPPMTWRQLQVSMFEPAS